VNPRAILLRPGRKYGSTLSAFDMDMGWIKTSPADIGGTMEYSSSICFQLCHFPQIRLAFKFFVGAACSCGHWLGWEEERSFGLCLCSRHPRNRAQSKQDATERVGGPDLWQLSGCRVSLSAPSISLAGERHAIEQGKFTAYLKPRLKPGTHATARSLP
jgi:hypothetical protein